MCKQRDKTPSEKYLGRKKSPPIYTMNSKKMVRSFFLLSQQHVHVQNRWLKELLQYILPCEKYYLIRKGNIKVVYQDWLDG